MELAQHASALTVPISSRDHVLGPADAPAKLLEYGDYECPFCGEAYPNVSALLDQLGDSVQFAYRHFPVASLHPHAPRAAEAAEAAGAQGQFWAMHDLLFQNQDALELEDLQAYAQAIGLDLDRFETDLMDHRHAERVRQDFRSGIRGGVNGTPTFFVNGVRHDGDYDLGSLLAAVAPAADLARGR
jgi:protein-disulfide isomerase